MSIEEKFRRFEKYIRTDLPAQKSLHLDKIANELSGQLVSAPEGSYIIKEKAYGPGDLHGQFSFSQLDPEKPLKFENYSCPPDEGDFSLKDIVVIDTETTGLSGGVGTVPFLVGLGFFRDNSFIIRQHFLPDYSEEHGFLLNLFSDLPGDLIVSFNGKAFDMPLLVNRFLIQRLDSDFFSHRHLDVLFTLRRFFKLKLPDCTLKTAEMNLLSFERLNDIPSEQIPQTYFNYLRSGQCDEIYQVIVHNLWDIVSTMGVMVELNRFVEKSTSSEILSEVDSWSLGKFFLQRKDYDKALDNFAKSDNKDSDYYHKNLFQASLIHKRRKDYDTAVNYWEMLTESFNPHYLAALEELAKVYEHKIRDYSAALRFCRRAIDAIQQLSQLDSQAGFESYEALFARRIERLRLKSDKSK
jgi:uncharacterized protein YprB with RNaseH-like and TPR domain